MDASEPTALRLPSDVRGPAGYEAARVALSLPAASAAVHAAAFAAWLARVSGQAEVPLAIDGRESVLAVADASGRSLVAAIAAARGEPVERSAAAITHGEPRVAAELHVMVSAGGAELVYNARAFRAATAARFAGQLAVLAAALAAELDAPIAHLALLTPDEAGWLDQIGRGAPRGTPAELTPARFARLAAATPDAIAVRHREARLTYGELAARVNQLARALVARGADGAHVAVCLEPGVDIAVALLGALAAGAVYVPVDPTYPAARIRAILDETQPAVLVTRAALADRLGLAADPLLDLASPALAALSPAPVALPTHADDPAYVYFTSGTTGKPKGVLATHSNLAFYLQVARERYAMTARDVIPAIARFSFSISMFELLSPLLAGGTLLVLDRDHVLDPARMAATFDEVTLFHAGPSLLKHVLPHLIGRDFPNVRHASSGGDLIAPELLATLARMFASAEIFVIYGSSEISCMGCTYPVDRAALPERTFVGRPFDDVTVCLLDTAGERVPIGVAGEIHFAGAGVVAGYLGRPELTAERFVQRAGERWYRMGDMGRWSADGWLEILGRNDFQIKIRGMRVELGEVDLHVRRAPGVRDAVVVAQAGPGGDKIMVAYVVLAAPASAPHAEQLAQVRRHLVDTLPDYMVPAQYAVLDALPVNHNLKLDRNALPPLAALAAPATAVRAAATPTERALAAIWQRTLGVAQAGLDDNFFELGGDSMLALELIMEAQRALGVELDGMDVLRESLEVLAAACDRELGKPVAARPGAAPATARDAITAFHFGPRAELYGVLHEAAAPARTAVLIVPPLGQDRVRTHFVLTRLARQLAAAGTPALRFDLFGQGDSLGDDRDGTPTRWRADITAAAAELARRTGAPRLVAIGVRLGATLLATAVPAGVARVILWDPIANGARHHGELSSLHDAHLRGVQDLRLGRAPIRRGDGDELLGMTYARAALRELDGLALPAQLATPVAWLATAGTTAPTALAAAHAQLAIDCGWRDLARLEDMLPDLGLSRALAQLVEAP